MPETLEVSFWAMHVQSLQAATTFREYPVASFEAEVVIDQTDNFHGLRTASEMLSSVA
jgi:hypothetical protein